MPLELGTYISDLNPANPLGSDPIAFVDDHLRLVKSTLKTTFPNITGAVTAPHTSLNNIPANTAQSIATLQSQFTALVEAADGMAVVPAGGIIMWSGASTAIPTGWFLCNGSNGTPDLRNRFVIGAGGSYNVGVSGGSKDAVVVSHTHTATTTISDPGHTHNIQHSNDSATAGSFISGNDGPTESSYASDSATTGITAATVLTASGVDGTDKNLPPYYALCFIMKG